MSAPIHDLAGFYKNLKAENVDLVANTNLVWLSPDVIEEEEGFNLRDYDQPDTVAHIEKLAQAWARADQMPPLEVKVKDGHCYVRDGHCRLRAAKLAMSRGAAVRRVSVIELKGNDDQANVRLLTSNNSLKLTHIQRGRGYERLRNFGWTDAEIAKSVGQTETTVRDLIRLLTLPTSLQKLIESDVISSGFCWKMYRIHGNDAIDMLQQVYGQLVAEHGSESANASQEGAAPNNTSENAPASVVPPKIRLQAKHFKKRSRPLSRTFTRDVVPAFTELRQVMTKATPSKTAASVKVDLPIELYNKLLGLSDMIFSEGEKKDGPVKPAGQLQLEVLEDQVA